ncbi:MAG: hypothetical protein AAF449_24680 [Myxococcota bacterium]
MLGVLIGGLLSVGCVAEIKSPENETPPQQEPPPPVSTENVVVSTKARIRFLGGQRYAMRLSEGLDLARQEVCRELGSFDCANEAHNIVLGGVDAEKLGFFEPLPQTAISTPFAADRIALSACSKVAERELSTPENAALFQLYADQNGQVDDDDPALAIAVRELYVRVLQRQPSDDERAALLALYPAIKATGTAQAAYDWAVATCFAVSTTEEALFY